MYTTHQRQWYIKIMEANLTFLRLDNKLIDRPILIATATAAAASSTPR